MPHTRSKPPVRLPYHSTDSDRLLSDQISELQIRNPTRSRYEEVERWGVTSSETTASSGFGGSLFSGENESATATATATATTEGTTGGLMLEEVEAMARGKGKGKGKEEDWAKRARESYYLQLTLATRVTWQAFLAEDRSVLVPEIESNGVDRVCTDSATVSYRLWV